jgi:broad specificity phosphatase PhoE
MQTIIYLIRHGEVDNPRHIIYGRLPGFGLSEKGKKQLEQSGNFLADKKITQFIASPLLRAQQSAEMINSHLALPSIQKADEIIEVKTSYQGRKFDSIDDLQSEIYLKPLQKDDETIEQLTNRMVQYITQQKRKHHDKSIAIISHGDPLMALIAAMKKLPPTFASIKKTHAYINHGEVYQLTFDENDKATIISVFQPTIE